jgi:hypothetical protein
MHVVGVGMIALAKRLNCSDISNLYCVAQVFHDPLAIVEPLPASPRAKNQYVPCWGFMDGLSLVTTTWRLRSFSSVGRTAPKAADVN